MAKKQNEIVSTAIAAAMGAESGVAPPPRNRSSSLASAIADLEVGDAPASRVQPMDYELTVAEAIDAIPAMSEKLRNSVMSSVQQARRRLPGHDYSIQVTNVTTKTGMYLLAMVTRTA